MQNNKTVTTYFNEEELYNQLREVSHDLDWAPDELIVRPEFFRKLEEEYNAHYGYTYFENAHKNSLPTYYGVKIKIDDKLDKPFKFMRGGKEA
jgi:hypothetical protein